jgi:glycosyltransferase involved in cell wall biosynthesis
LRICLLCYRGNPYCGGQGIYLKYVAEELLNQGHDVHVLVGPPYPELKKGITVHYIRNNEYFIKGRRTMIDPGTPFDILGPLNFYEYFSSRFGAFPEIRAFSIRAYLKLRELTRKIRFDIIHDNQCLGYGLLLMKTLGVPVVATIHHPLYIDLVNIIETASTFFNASKAVMFYPILMQRVVSKRLDHIIAVSEDSRIRNNIHFGVPLEKQTVVYNGLDRSVFRQMREVKKIRGKVLFVGNVIDKKKGFPYLLRAMRNVVDEINLTVIDGGSPHRKGIEDLIAHLGLKNRIEFAGKVTTDELVRQYNEAEITVVPSLYEGFGFPAAEAMSCGTPVVSSDGGALPEVVGESGVTYPARDEFALAEALNNLYSDKKKMKDCGEKGQERVEKYFNWPNAVDNMIQIYSKFV